MGRRSPFWECNVCLAQNSIEDGTCQWCDCLGAACERDNCDGEGHRTTNPEDQS